MQVGGGDRLQTKRAGEKLAIPGRIDKKSSVDFDFAGGLYALKVPGTFMPQLANLEMIQVNHAGSQRTLHQVSVEISANQCVSAWRRRGWRRPAVSWHWPRAARRAVRLMAEEAETSL